MKRYIGQGPEESQAQELLSLWSPRVLPFWHMDAFTNLETEPLHWGFLWLQYVGMIKLLTTGY